MICFDSEFFKEFTDFILNNNNPTTLNRHLIFAITSFLFAAAIYFLNSILFYLRKKDYLNFNTETTNSWGRFFLWILGSFIISFILTTTEVINIKIISAMIIGFAWDKLFADLHKNLGQSKEPRNPTSLENDN